jgi:hypothetical protein
MAALMWIIVFLFLISLTYWFFTHRLAAWSSPRSEGRTPFTAPSPLAYASPSPFVVGGLALLQSSQVWWSFVQDRARWFRSSVLSCRNRWSRGLRYANGQQVTRYDVRTQTYTMSQRPRR